MSNAVRARRSPSSRTISRVSFLGAVLALLGAAGCGPPPIAVAPLSYSNQTSIAVDLFVNGTKLTTVAPGVEGKAPVSILPPLPWAVTAQTGKGRVIASFSVKPGDVIESGSGQRGAGIRSDLSCGRLDIWAGPPLAGPPPGPGTPGDCDG